jgi:hypothetical protein
MIDLYNKKDLFILIDGENAGWAGNCIFEGINEVVTAFQGWAECDEYEDPKLINWTIGECLAHWNLDLKWYTGSDFVEAPDRFIDHMINYEDIKLNA